MQFINFDMKFITLFIFSMSLFVGHAEITLPVSVGDIIEIDGQKAIVFTTDDSGEHGTAMTVKAFRGVDNPWCSNGKSAKKMPATTNEIDGEANSMAVINFAKQNNVLADFPAFQWCNNLGSKWYIPSLKELEAFVNYWLGNEEILQWDEDSEQELDPTKQFFKDVNMKLLDAGGTPFINGVYTSTTNTDGKVYVFNYDRRKNVWSFKLKNRTNLGQDCVGRAFIKF